MGQEERKETKMPTGFAFGLAMNEKAMENFAGMNQEQKSKVIDSARNVQSKAQMEGLVRDVEKGTSF